jgi:hypothetical protein
MRAQFSAVDRTAIGSGEDMWHLGGEEKNNAGRHVAMLEPFEDIINR